MNKVVYFPKCILPDDDIADADIETTEVIVPGLMRTHAPLRAGRFLRGPIPWGDLSKAAAVGGKALALFVVIHHQCALRRSRTVKLPSSLLAELCIGRKAAANALDRLESVGLITVQHHNKSKPVITLVSQTTKQESSNAQKGRVHEPA